MNGPLFILAPPRTFTSIVCAMIGQHPQMYGLPEVNLFAADTYGGLERSVYHRRPGFRHGLLRAVAELALGEQSVDNVQEAQLWLEEHRDVPTRDLYSDLAAWAEPRRLVEKSPLHAYAADALGRIAAAAPDACYLHLTRHPRGTCESVYRLRADVRERMEKGGMAGRATKLPAEQRFADAQDPVSIWLRPHERILRFLETIPHERQRRLHGEDFMADPEQHLVPLCEWLGISTDAAALEAMRHPEASPFACYGPRNARFGNDPTFLEHPRLRPYAARPLSLDGPLEGGEGRVLDAAVKVFAARLGYA